MKEVEIWTDGACSKNPGPGGWAAVLKYGERKIEISGYDPDTTNNIMEMTAVIQALKMLKEPCRVELFTDSRYIVDSVTQWIEGWIRNGWKTAGKKPVKNMDLWKDMLELSRQHSIKWNWVKGHVGNELNELCDNLARNEISKNSKDRDV